MSYLYAPSPVSAGSPEQYFPETGSKWKERNDRQLRLWGIHGQERIDNANVCLLGATSVGAETLKNLVLPGFGKFTVVDDKKVTPRDLGINFFVTKDGLGQSRARIVCENLAELNPDNVTGQFLEESPLTVIEKEPDFFDSYSFIIASQLDSQTLRKLAKICWEKDKVLIVVRSYGLCGYVRTVTRSHQVIEAKMDNEQDDLRLYEPFPELLQFCMSQDMEKMSDKEFRDTPYPVILVRQLQKWRQEHQGQGPANRQEKDEFVKRLHEASQTPDMPPENFREAIEKAHLAWTPHEIPKNVDKVLKHKNAQPQNLTTDTPMFWFLAAALKQFVEKEKHLPVQGIVPDMEADTDRYIKLQTIYRRKARHDAHQLKGYLQSLLKQVGLPEDSVSDVDIKEFCKNALYIHHFEIRSIEQELDIKTANKERIANKLMEDGEESPVIFYLCLVAGDRFFEKHGRYPGSNGKEEEEANEFLNTEQMEKDAEEFKQILSELVKEYEIADDAFSVENYAKEWTRYGAAELHNVSALIGGVAAQELIKLCTKQRLPLNNTWVFNGIASNSAAFKA